MGTKQHPKVSSLELMDKKAVGAEPNDDILRLLLAFNTRKIFARHSEIR